MKCSNYSGPKIFNSIPAFIRNTRNCPLDYFKAKFGNWLEKDQYEPIVRGLTPGGCDADARASNSIIYQARVIQIGHVHMSSYQMEE